MLLALVKSCSQRPDRARTLEIIIIIIIIVYYYYHLGDAGVIAAEGETLRPHPRLKTAGSLVIRVSRRLNQIINPLAGGPVIRFE